MILFRYITMKLAKKVFTYSLKGTLPKKTTKKTKQNSLFNNKGRNEGGKSVKLYSVHIFCAKKNLSCIFSGFNG